MCQFCGSTMASPDPLSGRVASSVCPNCGKSNTGQIIGINDRKPDDKGKQYNPFSTNQPLFFNKHNPIAAKNKNNIKNAKKEKKDDDVPKAKDVFVSEEIKQCPDLIELKNKRNKDIYVDKDMEVTKSCEDLAIDG